MVSASHPSSNRPLFVNLGLAFVFWLLMLLGKHFITFTCPYFSPEVMVKFKRKVRGRFVTLIEIATHLTE